MTGAFLALALLAGAGQSPSPSDQPITVTGEREKPVCKMERSTGSVLPKRVCTTAAERQRQTARGVQMKSQFIERLEQEREVRFLEENLMKK